jgi:DNA-binding CsgD family transcriptional regulator
MRHFLLFFWIFSFSVGLSSLGMTLIQWLRNRDLESKDHFFVLLSFTLMVLALTIMNYCAMNNIKGAAGLLSDLFSYLALGYLSYQLVDFANAMATLKHRNKIRLILASVIPLMILPAVLSLFYPALRAWALLAFLMLGLSIAYIVFHAVFTKNKKVLFSREMALTITIASVVCFPGFILVDVFYDWIPVVRNNIPRGFYSMPLFYLVWSLMNLRDQFLYHNRPPTPETIPPEWELSPRERDVLALLLKGRTYGEIGEALYISLSTVKTHVERIYRKSGTTGKMELLMKYNKQTG